MSKPVTDIFYIKHVLCWTRTRVFNFMLFKFYMDILSYIHINACVYVLWPEAYFCLEPFRVTPPLLLLATHMYVYLSPWENSYKLWSDRLQRVSKWASPIILVSIVSIRHKWYDCLLVFPLPHNNMFCCELFVKYISWFKKL